MRQISFLLGAGFSIPKGYPSGSDLNKAIQSFNPKHWHVGSAYELVRVKETDQFYSGNDFLKHFLFDMIQFFANNFPFDYEEFYDFLVKPKEYKEIKDVFDKDFPVKWNTDRLSNYCHQALIIYNKLIPTFIRDGRGRTRYPKIGYGRGTLSPHNNFLSLLETLATQYDLIHIHTLNHDLVFESFKYSDYLSGQLSDGFEELGSPYYGVLRTDEEVTYTVKLEYFTNVFKDKFRLYKLHGSIDYAPVRNSEGHVEAYLKTLPKIGYSDFLKEIISGTEIKYHKDWLNHHADYLSGTTSKILRYSEPVFYDKIFKHFESNVYNSDRLLIVGYGCKDTEVNSIIARNTSHHKISPVIFEPYPSSTTFELRNLINGKILVNSIEDIDVSLDRPRLYLKTLKPKK